MSPPSSPPRSAGSTGSAGSVADPGSQTPAFTATDSKRRPMPAMRGAFFRSRPQTPSPTTGARRFKAKGGDFESLITQKVGRCAVSRETGGGPDGSIASTRSPPAASHRARAWPVTTLAQSGAVAYVGAFSARCRAQGSQISAAPGTAPQHQRFPSRTGLMRASRRRGFLLYR